MRLVFDKRSGGHSARKGQKSQRLDFGYFRTRRNGARGGRRFHHDEYFGINEGKFEITAYNVTNDPIPPKPPVDDPIKNTGDSIVLQILALSLLLAGMAVVVTATRLRRKETTK